MRALEQTLRDERERIRIAAAQEVARLQTALRESAERASQREREVQVLTGELQKREPARPPRARRSLRPGRDETDTSGALERVLATFERERRELEERARAVAETELRQRAAAAELQAEAERLALAEVDLEERRGLSSELQAAGKRIEKLERLLEEHNETRASLKVATVELAALGKAAQQRREAEAALLATRARLTEVERKLELATASGAVAVAHTAGSEREAEERIEELLARRERELEEHAASDLAVRREQLEQSMATDLDRRRDELESGTRAELARREQLLAAATAEELVRRRQELEREAAAARERLRAGGDEELSRERAGPARGATGPGTRAGAPRGRGDAPRDRAVGRQPPDRRRGAAAAGAHVAHRRPGAARLSGIARPPFGRADVHRGLAAPEPEPRGRRRVRRKLVACRRCCCSPISAPHRRPAWRAWAPPSSSSRSSARS